MLLVIIIIKKNTFKLGRDLGAVDFQGREDRVQWYTGAGEKWRDFFYVFAHFKQSQKSFRGCGSLKNNFNLLCFLAVVSATCGLK